MARDTVAITVRFPAMLHRRTGREVTLSDPGLTTMAALLDALDQRFPGLASELSDPIYNLAVNDEMLLHGVRTRELAADDVVEVVPAISGG